MVPYGASRSTCPPTATAAARPPRSTRSPPRCTSFSVRWRLTARSWSATRCRVGWPPSTRGPSEPRPRHHRQRARHPAVRGARPTARACAVRPGLHPGVADVRGQPRTRTHPRARALARARNTRGETGRRRRLLAAVLRTDPDELQALIDAQIRSSTCRASASSGDRSPTASASGSDGCQTCSSRNGPATATSFTSSIPTASPLGCPVRRPLRLITLVG